MLKNPWVVIGIITVILFGGAFLFSGGQSQVNNEGVEVVATHVKGNPDASVVLVEYSDFQCPACASFQPVITELMTEYGNKIRLEYKHFPLPMHRYAMPAAVATEAAGQQGKFFEFHDLLFANQGTWSGSASPNTFFIQYAGEIGLDVDLFKRQMNSSLLRDKVRADRNEGNELTVTGTPTFFLNGERMQFDTFAGFVEQILLAIDPELIEAVNSDDSSQNLPEVKFGI